MILAEIRSLREDFHSFSRESGERIATLEIHVKTGITGNGTPSRLSLVERTVESLQRWRWMILGGAGTISALVTYSFHLLSLK
jgi:hypothetical protein